MRCRSLCWLLDDLKRVNRVAGIDSTDTLLYLRACRELSSTGNTLSISRFFSLSLFLSLPSLSPSLSLPYKHRGKQPIPQHQMELEPCKDTSDPPPPSDTSVSNGHKDVEDGRKPASSMEEQSKDGEPTETPRRTMTKKDVTCLLGVITAITLLTCAFVACVVVGLMVVGPYCTAARFIRSNCTNVSSTMGKETYTCSCGKHCTKQCTRNCLRVTVSYSDPSSGEEYSGLFRVDETGLDSEVICLQIYLIFEDFYDVCVL